MPIQNALLRTKFYSIETFQELTQAANKMNNRFSEIRYHAYELNAYYKNLKFSRQTFWRTLGEVINLGFNKYSNFFGLYWGLALLWIVIFGVGGYIGYFYSLHSGACLGEHFGKVFIFINPVHKVDFMGEGFDNYLKNGPLVIDSVMRIIMAYLYYQFVAAFRKYGKKSGNQ